MRKIILLSILLMLFAVAIPFVSADITAELKPVPSIITADADVSIVACNPNGSSFFRVKTISVTRPDGVIDTISPREGLNVGNCASWSYPGNFGGSTNVTGTYTISMEYGTAFSTQITSTTFKVIPEVPLFPSVYTAMFLVFATATLSFVVYRKVW